MEGFTMICNKCGNKTVLKTNEDLYNAQYFSQQNQVTININYGYEEFGLKCECGNVFTDDMEVE